MTCACGAARLAVVLWACAVAAGQEPGAGESSADPLGAVRNRTTLGAAEDRAIDAWIAARRDQLRADMRNGEAAAAVAFRAAFQVELKNPASTQQYLGRLAERTASVAIEEFGSGDAGDVVVDRAFAEVLLNLDRVSTREALAAGLRHPAEPVRYLCARAYAKLKPAIAADSQLTRRTIAQLAEAGAAESNPVVLGAIYEALSYDQASDLDATVEAMVTVLAASVAARQSEQRLRADRAELVAFEFLLSVRNRIPETSRPPLVRQLAALLVLDVDRYAAALPDERRDLEERVEVGESLLEALAGQGGDVRGAMKKGGAGAEEAMGVELRKWVGGGGQQGALNKAPWAVPPGGLP